MPDTAQTVEPPDTVYSAWNGGWRWGRIEQGQFSPHEWSRPFKTKEEAIADSIPPRID